MIFGISEWPIAFRMKEISQLPNSKISKFDLVTYLLAYSDRFSVITVPVFER
jgi:hypothetical protein